MVLLSLCLSMKDLVGFIKFWLKEMQKNKMLRLFGIAENDSGHLFV